MSCRYNGQRIVATKALEDLHWRATHSLLAPAHMVRQKIYILRDVYLLYEAYQETCYIVILGLTRKQVGGEGWGDEGRGWRCLLEGKGLLQ